MNKSEIQKLADKSNSWPFVEARILRDRLKKIGSNSGEGNEVPVLFETGYGPSGLPHIGTFGEVARTNIVRFAFQTLTGKYTKLICFLGNQSGLIMDQWTSRSINLLMGSKIVKLQNNSVLKKNTSYVYSKFLSCVAIVFDLI